jgi:hypothetical protein
MAPGRKGMERPPQRRVPRGRGGGRDTARAATRETARREPGFATIFVYSDNLGLELRTGRASGTSGIDPVLGFQKRRIVPKRTIGSTV